MKNKLLKMVVLMMLLTMVFSTNVLAAEGEDEVNLLSETSEYCEYEETETVTNTFKIGKVWHTIELNANFSLGYTYSEGSWVYTSYYGIDVNWAKIDGTLVPVTVDTSQGGSNSFGGVEYVVANIIYEFEIGVRVDEYGEVTTYVNYCRTVD